MLKDKVLLESALDTAERLENEVVVESVLKRVEDVEVVN